tara:strand:- start:1851 stop:2729 length:879 start_codon:yes stop_codon:yes gene_type:complete
MAYLTDYQYYLGSGGAESENHGSYQYISLTDIIRNYMLMHVGEDQKVDNVPIYKVRFTAKQAVKELNYDAFKSTKIVEDVVESSLKYVMPSDYVDFIRISKLVDGVMYPMTENRNAMSADVYLRNNNNQILFDNAGEVLLENSSELERSRINNTTTTEDSNEECHRYSIGAKYFLDTALANGNPTFRVNRAAGVIDFDSTMSGATIILEYISDGMEGGNDSLIMINKFFEKYIYAYITYELLDSKFGIADGIRTRARQKQRALYRNARVRMNGMSQLDLLMTLRGQNKWNKG